jgi:carboxypeptidase family protein
MSKERARASRRRIVPLACACALFVITLLAVTPPAIPAQEGPQGPPDRNAPAASPSATPAAPSGSPAETPAAGPLSPAGAPPSSGRKVTGRIRGTIYGGAKKPVAGLLVILSSREQAGLLRVTNTDEVGQYLFSDLPAGSYAVEVTPDAYVQQKKGGIDVHPPFQNMVDFQLMPGGSARDVAPAARAAPPVPQGGQDSPGGPPDTGAAPVRGTLLDQRKQPVVEVSVTLVSEADKRIYQTLSNEDGTFSIASVPPGRYRVLVASPGHVGLDLKSVVIDPKNGLDLSLCLVDYPLNFLGDKDNLLPRERARAGPLATAGATPTPSPAPGPGATPAPSPAPAPSRAPGPASAPGGAAPRPTPSA